MAKRRAKRKGRKICVKKSLIKGRWKCTKKRRVKRRRRR